MEQRAFDLIAFDGDDTLWHNERSYRQARERFRNMLSSAGVSLSEEEIDQRVSETEVANIEYYGYGVSSFTLSMIETAIELTQGKLGGGDIRVLIELAKQMLREEVELFPGATEAVATLAETYPLALVTKGDLLHQTSKLDRSGLRRHFRFVEVVSHKTPAAYAEILGRHGVEASRFMMVGNSLRSDVLPVIELGGWAVHVPAAVSWFHEHAEVPDAGNSRYVELPTLERLPALVENLDILERTTPLGG
ncbi:MAG TPA: HAD family hydrolase [Vicinamibacterales bacterium]|nr:HAD family hydrolase [Vicinamibacterales bacterium]